MDKVPTLAPEKSDQMAALPLGAGAAPTRSWAVASAPAAFRVRGWQIASGDRRATWEATAANVGFYEAAARVKCVALVNVVPFSRGSVIRLFAL